MDLIDRFVDLAQPVPDLDEESELLFQVSLSYFDTRVEFKFQRRGLTPAVQAKTHLVLAGESQRTPRAQFVLPQVVAGHACGRLVAQVPNETVKTCLGLDLFLRLLAFGIRRFLRQLQLLA